MAEKTHDTPKRRQRTRTLEDNSSPYSERLKKTDVEQEAQEGIRWRERERKTKGRDEMSRSRKRWSSLLL